MVENIKRLSADLELRTFPPGNTEVLHDRWVGVEEHGAVNLVPAFPAKGGDASGDNGRGEVRRRQTRPACSLTATENDSTFQIVWEHLPD